MQCYDLASRERLLEKIIRVLTDGHVIKWAFNASFERVRLSIWVRKNYPQYFKDYGSPDDPLYGKYLDQALWRCSLVLSAYNSLLLSLEMVGAVFGFGKPKEGHELIRFLALPAPIQKQMAAERATASRILLKNGHFSKSTISAVWKSRCRFTSV